MSTPNPVPGASISDILTAIKNIVTALATASQNYLNVNGQVTISSISAPVVLKVSAGRVASVSVIVGGAVGAIYDGATLTSTTKQLYVIPDTVSGQPYVVNMPVSVGILIVPGAGQTVTVSYS
jgi:hypothetical protein